ncbi:MAG: winged helix-turn-helix transcriptional regulator [Gammaproteobacteria bacterium]
MEKLKENKTQKFPVSRMVEDIVGCKWSLSVLKAIRNELQRPGEIQRSIEGISTKVLNERFIKMMRYGILVKKVHPEVPPRVEYKLTDFGKKFVAILDQIDSLQNDVS